MIGDSVFGNNVFNGEVKNSTGQLTGQEKPLVITIKPGTVKPKQQNNFYWQNKDEEEVPFPIVLKQGEDDEPLRNKAEVIISEESNSLNTIIEYSKMKKNDFITYVAIELFKSYDFINGKDPINKVASSSVDCATELYSILKYKKILQS